MPVTRQLDERGQVGGVEVIPFGVLVLMIGALLIANVWGVIDAKLAAESAAREAARAYVEAPNEAAAVERGRDAADGAMRGHNRELSAMRVSAPETGSFRRCNRIQYTVEYDVPTLTLPWIGGLGGGLITARATHSEIIDPYRSGLDVDGEAACDA
jgi:hypothetical protein